MNKHRIVLLIVLVAIGFGYFTLIRFQHANALPPAGAVVSGQGGLVINGRSTGGGLVVNPTVVDDAGITPAASGTFLPADAVDPDLAVEEGESCP